MFIRDMTKDEFKDIAYHILLWCPKDTKRFELEIWWETYWINQCIKEYEKLKHYWERDKEWSIIWGNWFEDLYNVLCKKNSDYSWWNLAFQNFFLSENVWVSIEDGLKVRMCDKISRIRNLQDKEPSVIWESLADSYGDLAWYLLILYIYLYWDKFLPEKS